MTSDLVVESREWRGRVEIVSHINHTQIARVRSALDGKGRLRTADGAGSRISRTVTDPPRVIAASDVSGGRRARENPVGVWAHGNSSHGQAGSSVHG